MANRTRTTRETMEIRRNRQEAQDMLEGRIPAPAFTMLAFDDWRFAQTAAQVHQLVGGSGMNGTIEFYTFVPACQNGLAPPTNREMDQARKQQNRATHIPTYYNGIVPPLTARREAEIETVRRLTMAARGRDPDDGRPGPIPNSRPPTAGSAQDEDDDIREAIAASLAEMQAEQDHNDIQAAIAASLAEMKAAQNNRGRNQQQRTRPDPALRPHPPAPPSPKSDDDSDTQAAIAASLADSREDPDTQAAIAPSLADSREDPDTQAAIAASLADMREQKRKKPASPKRPAWNAYTPRSQNQAASSARPAAARAGTSSNPPRPVPRTPLPVPSNINSSEPRTLRNLTGSVMERLRHPFRRTPSVPTQAQTPGAPPPGQASRTPQPPTPTRVPQRQTTPCAQRPPARQRRTPSPPSTQRERPPANNAGNRNRPAARTANTRLPRPAVATPAPLPGRSDRRLYPRDPTTSRFLSDVDWDAQIT